MSFFEGIIGIFSGGGSQPPSHHNGGGYYDTLQGRENQMPDSIARSQAREQADRERRAREDRQREEAQAVARREQQMMEANRRQEENRRREEEERAIQHERGRQGFLESSRLVGIAIEAGWDRDRKLQPLRDAREQLSIAQAMASTNCQDPSQRIHPSQQVSLDLSAVLLSAASDLSLADDSSFSPDPEGFDILQSARTLTDFVLNFVPIASLAKDLVCLATSINPITNEAIENVEYGLIAAGILVPGVLRGSAIGITKSIRVVNLALHNSSSATSTATRLLPPLQAADHFLLSLAKDATELAEFAPEATQRLSQALVHVGPAVAQSAAQLRNSPGTALISRELFDSAKFLNGTHANAGLVPLDIAQRLEGRVFKSFDQFRKEFWLATSESKYAAQWGPLNLRDMKKGLAPMSRESQKVGARSLYELHHIQPIQRGGEVYDLANIMVVSPKFHLDVLDRSYHFGH